jgi:hypothetical protein
MLLSEKKEQYTRARPYKTRKVNEKNMDSTRID